MKYSIRGNLAATVDDSSVVSLINQYELWRLISYRSVNRNKVECLTFEVWLNTAEDKSGLYDALKTFVDQYGGQINWHECTHDESESSPCEISEEYRSD